MSQVIQIENESIALLCDEDGNGLEIVDRRRGTRWALDRETLVWSNQTAPQVREALVPIAARMDGGQTLILTCRAGTVSLEVQYSLHDDYVEARLPVPDAGEVRFISLPGSFAPLGERLQLLLPIMQGMLWDGRGPALDTVRGEGAHTGFAMAFLGYLGERGGLLATAETRDDHVWWFGKDQAERMWATNVQIDSLGAMRYERIVRLYPVDADIATLARRYRARVQERGQFVSWEQKMAVRPGLERLFGAVMCFVGYCQDDLDYVAACRQLRDYGFERALVYPARFSVYHSDLHMGGRPAIDLGAEQVAGIKALGYDVAPWSWLNEARDDGTAGIRGLLRRDAQNEAIRHWAIDDQQWYLICYSFLEQVQQRALQGPLADLTWDHFDVLACVAGLECYALDHAPHLGRPLSRAENREGVRRAFQADAARGMAVSSENFNDAFALDYDLGSVKAWPQYGPWPFWPVPLTMLVYHDSLIHSWWEVHNYNSPWFGRTRSTSPWFEYGGGRPALMAALDALMGCPPDVFPFGAQYGWTGRGTETFLYRYRFEDPEVQLALRHALPVARLHRRIGRQEMVHFRFLSEDGYVQESAFADGTRVVANFSREVVGARRGAVPAALDGVDSLMPESWQVI